MSTSTPSSGRIVGTVTVADEHALAIVSVPVEAHVAANDDTHAPDYDHGVNPLWMITAALGILIGLMAVAVATN